MSSDLIRLTEGDNNVVWTFTCKRAGAVVDLTGPLAVTLYVHDDDAAEGTNIVNGSSCTVTDAAAGECTFTFTTSHTVIGGTGRVLKGKWKLKVVSESFDEGEFRIEKDVFTA